MKITLTDLEIKIFNLLKDVILTKAPNTTLRIAGGWVRDKLLQLQCNDIDISVDNMTGESFANLVSDYLLAHGKKQTVTIVEANPDQSKHLATAMIRLFGLPIDFVNLRTESYANTRIPTMAFGTPLEDAQRRDLTINSLFYNINSDEVEDYVGGINDLENLIARTPTDSVQTFLDDPLRILRTIRFAAKYGLFLDPDLVAATQLPNVQEAFRRKISPERIWAELAGKKEGDTYKAGALIGKNPARAISLLKIFGLLDIIFEPTNTDIKGLYKPKNNEEVPEYLMVPWNTEQNNPHHAFDIWTHTFNVVTYLVENTTNEIKQDQETYLVRNLSALLHDIGKRYTGIHGNKNGYTSYHGHEEISGKLTEKILARLRVPQNIIKRVVDLINIHLSPRTLLETGNGKNYRRFARNNIDWMHSIDLAIADNLGKKEFLPEEVYNEVQKYETLRSKIKDAMQWEGKPPLVTGIPRPINGNDLLALGLKPGPLIGKILEAIDEALLDNPGMSKEEALVIANGFI